MCKTDSISVALGDLDSDGDLDAMVEINSGAVEPVNRTDGTLPTCYRY